MDNNDPSLELEQSQVAPIAPSADKGQEENCFYVPPTSTTPEVTDSIPPPSLLDFPLIDPVFPSPTRPVASDCEDPPFSPTGRCPPDRPPIDGCHSPSSLRLGTTHSDCGNYPVPKTISSPFEIRRISTPHRNLTPTPFFGPFLEPVPEIPRSSPSNPAFPSRVRLPDLELVLDPELRLPEDPVQIPVVVLSPRKNHPDSGPNPSFPCPHSPLRSKSPFSTSTSRFTPSPDTPLIPPSPDLTDIPGPSTIGPNPNPKPLFPSLNPQCPSSRPLREVRKRQAAITPSWMPTVRKKRVRRDFDQECSKVPCLKPHLLTSLEVGTPDILWVQCDQCNQWFHRYCMSISPASPLPEFYYCPSCLVAKSTLHALLARPRSFNRCNPVRNELNMPSHRIYTHCDSPTDCNCPDLTRSNPEMESPAVGPSSIQICISLTPRELLTLITENQSVRSPDDQSHPTSQSTLQHSLHRPPSRHCSATESSFASPAPSSPFPGSLLSRSGPFDPLNRPEIVSPIFPGRPDDVDEPKAPPGPSVRPKTSPYYPSSSKEPVFENPKSLSRPEKSKLPRHPIRYPPESPRRQSGICSPIYSLPRRPSPSHTELEETANGFSTANLWTAIPYSSPLAPSRGMVEWTPDLVDAEREFRQSSSPSIRPVRQVLSTSSRRPSVADSLFRTQTLPVSSEEPFVTLGAATKPKEVDEIRTHLAAAVLSPLPLGVEPRGRGRGRSRGRIGIADGEPLRPAKGRGRSRGRVLPPPDLPSALGVDPSTPSTIPLTVCQGPYFEKEENYEARFYGYSTRSPPCEHVQKPVDPNGFKWANSLTTRVQRKVLKKREARPPHSYPLITLKPRQNSASAVLLTNSYTKKKFISQSVQTARDFISAPSDLRIAAGHNRITRQFCALCNTLGHLAFECSPADRPYIVPGGVCLPHGQFSHYN